MALLNVDTEALTVDTYSPMTKPNDEDSAVSDERELQRTSFLDAIDTVPKIAPVAGFLHTIRPSWSLPASAKAPWGLNASAKYSIHICLNLYVTN